MEQLPAVQSQTATLQTSPPDATAGVPTWGLILLGQVQRGMTIEDARSQRDISRQSVWELGQRFPHWYGALLAANHGAIQGRPVTHADVARAHAWDEEERRYQMAMGRVDDRAVRDRDALSAMELGRKIDASIGQGAQASASAAVVVRIEAPAAYNGRPLTTIDAQPHTNDSADPKETPTTPPPGAGSGQQDKG